MCVCARAPTYTPSLWANKAFAIPTSALGVCFCVLRVFRWSICVAADSTWYQKQLELKEKERAKKSVRKIISFSARHRNLAQLWRISLSNMFYMILSIVNASFIRQCDILRQYWRSARQRCSTIPELTDRISPARAPACSQTTHSKLIGTNILTMPWRACHDIPLKSGNGKNNKPKRKWIQTHNSVEHK